MNCCFVARLRIVGRAVLGLAGELLDFVLWAFFVGRGSMRRRETKMARVQKIRYVCCGKEINSRRSAGVEYEVVRERVSKNSAEESCRRLARCRIVAGVEDGAVGGE